MIAALVFDLDGTLVQTEVLKAKSYARAVANLSAGNIKEARVIDAYRTVVGLSRQEVAQNLLAEFDLENKARQKMERYGVRTAWQAFVQVRLKYYHELLGDSVNIINNRCPYSLALLAWAGENRFKTGLATMSHCKEATRVLGILDIAHKFNFIATYDDVNHGKPDPEIYHLMLNELGIPAPEGLAIEDSPAGIQAAQNAGLACIAVTNQFTRRSVHTCNLLDQQWIVDEPSDLQKTVAALVQGTSNRK